MANDNLVGDRGYCPNWASLYVWEATTVLDYKFKDDVTLHEHLNWSSYGSVSTCVI